MNPIRNAAIADYAQMHVVRTSVKENMLSDPSRVTESDYIDYITNRGEGWVYETDGRIVGFAIVDLRENNVWALFVLPEYEGRGIGGQLHEKMLTWYFAQKKETLWLSTTPNTKADDFYRKNGWKEVGVLGKDEIKFEMTFDDWQKKKITF